MITAIRPESIYPYEETLRECFSEQAESKEELDWLDNLKKVAWHRFNTTGFPSRSMEEWRNIDLSSVLKHKFTVEDTSVADISKEEILPWIYQESSDCLLVFVNGFFSSEHSSLCNLPEGVIISELSKAIKTHQDLIHSFLAKELVEEPDAFVSLNTSLFKHGAFIYIPPEAQFEKAVQILFVNKSHPDKALAVYPRNLLIVGENASLTVTASSIGIGDTNQPYLTNDVCEMFLSEGASVNYTQINLESNQVFNFDKTRAFLDANSHLSLSSVCMGKGISRNSIEAKLLGKGATLELYGLSVLNDNSEIYNHTEIDHISPQCTSRQLYKGILSDNTRSDFDGTITIHSNASESEASQLNQNLVLSENSRVFTRPNLKIGNDDVKCSHGATVGQLDSEQLFYMASRGLGYNTAKELLTIGFVEEIIQKIPVKSIRQQLRELSGKSLDFSDTEIKRQIEYD